MKLIDLLVFVFPLLIFLSTLLFSSTIYSVDIKSLSKQAESGDTGAQFQLGLHHDQKKGLLRNKKEAKKWYMEAASNGHVKAQNSLGSIYQEEENYIEAKKWYEMAANQNHMESITSLAYLYDIGLGVPENNQKAHELYMKAANMGDPNAMFNIAQTIGSGELLGYSSEYKGCIWNYLARRHLLAYKNSSIYKELKQRIEQVVNYCESALGSRNMKAKMEAAKWKLGDEI